VFGVGRAEQEVAAAHEVLHPHGAADQRGAAEADRYARGSALRANQRGQQAEHRAEAGYHDGGAAVWRSELLVGPPVRRTAVTRRARPGPRYHQTGPRRTPLLAAIAGRLARAVMQDMRRGVKQQHGLASVAALHAGVVTVVQRFRSDLGLYVHLHCLVTDGAYEEQGDGELRFLAAPPPPPERMTAVPAATSCARLSPTTPSRR
jgi:hypothetical protein